jgi:hypothetical protein
LLRDAREFVGEADGFGKAVCRRAADSPGIGGIERDAVADGDVDGTHGLFRAEEGAEHFAVVDEVRARAAPCGDDAVCADEARLGDADGRDVEKEAEVRGEAKATRVRVAVAVHEEEVWHALELLEGGEEDRSLAEGEKAGDVGEGERNFDGDLLDDFE